MGRSVTDAGLRHLRGLKKLRDVFCKGTGITRNGLIQLSKDVPRCFRRTIPPT